MTYDEEWEIRIARGRERFLVPTYTIKDQYQDPDSPYFCAAYYVDGERQAGIAIHGITNPIEVKEIPQPVVP